jgi:ATP-dependent RNA helicase RhlE
MSFEQLGLSAELLRAVAEEGYTTPTAIQSQAIPVVLEGKDVLAGAQTGTGKTAGFTLPLLQMLDAEAKETKAHRIRALVLTPTRELAAQVGEAVKTYGKHLDLNSAVIFGGVKINPQIAALKKGVDILIATPGRLLDHVGQGTLKLEDVEVLVLDEADRMLDMGFIHDIKKVLALLPPKRQNLLFSATYSDEIKALADELLNNPVPIEVARRNTAAETVAQKVVRVDKKSKPALLSYLVGSNDWRQVLVFTRTKHGANRLAQHLEKDGLTAAAIHGNKSQGARTRALAGFKSGDIRVLVATDIAARGLDIDQLPHVVNFELPNVAEDYVHRIGRTGRAGCEGEALSLVCVDEDKLLGDIQKLIGREIESEVVDGFEPDPSIKPEPIQNGRGNQRGRNGDGQGRAKGQGQRQADGRGRNNRRRGKNGGNEQGRNNGNGNANGRQRASANVQSKRTVDENGDVNGNTLFTDNSNRDAITLAGGNEIARRKRGGGNAKRGNGQGGSRAGNNGNGNGARRQAEGKGGQNRGGNKRRRSGNGSRGNTPSLLGS